MRRVLGALAFVLTCLLLFAVHPALASAHDGGQMHFFTNVVVEPDDVIDGDLNVFFGNVTVKGTVHGDVNDIGGTCAQLENAQIDGHVNCVWNDTARALMPWAAIAPGIGEIREEQHRMLGQLSSSAIVVLVFLLFPLRMRLALDRVERHPGLAALAGVGALIATIPITLFLVFSIIGIPLILLEVTAVFVGVLIGEGAIALLVGRRLFELVVPRTTPSPLAALVLGLVVISAAQILPHVGWAVTALVWLVSLGAAILAFLRSAGSGFTIGRPPIGGPPMNQSA
jgi:hypothetical protein